MKTNLLRAVLLASAAAAIAATTAFAADLSPPVLMAPQVYNWTGFYAGLNIGYAWGSDPVSAYAPNLSQ